MAIPGLFVEYLINGALALIWIYPLWIHPNLKKVNLDTIPTISLPLIVLGLYFIGMIIDFCAFMVLRPIKYKIRGRIERRYKISKERIPGKTADRNARFWLYTPELAKEVAMRSSRDRIARGVIINLIPATIFTLPVWMGVILFMLSVMMWIFFESSSYAFELKAEQALNEKNQQELVKMRA
ncbi:MAG: hypothetical protein JSV88_00405 [Candidatus Aminicenantes bacterium]|nr:MAG: hypothetical protein JSV88_00405 [Candidatus Aminicenantes bacterium]